jgi:hypothetical protein
MYSKLGHIPSTKTFMMTRQKQNLDLTRALNQDDTQTDGQTSDSGQNGSYAKKSKGRVAGVGSCLDGSNPKKKTKGRPWSFIHP